MVWATRLFSVCYTSSYFKLNPANFTYCRIRVRWALNFVGARPYVYVQRFEVTLYGGGLCCVQSQIRGPIFTFAGTIKLTETLAIFFANLPRTLLFLAQVLSFFSLVHILGFPTRLRMQISYASPIPLCYASRFSLFHGDNKASFCIRQPLVADFSRS